MAKVLLVEDDLNDVLLFKRAIRKANLPLDPDGPEMVLAPDGEAAVSYLQEGERPLPKVVFLDLKLPRKSGLEVLEWIRVQGGLRALPVVVLTASAEVQNLEQAYALGANAYLVKPGTLHQLEEITQVMGRFWLQFNQTLG